MIESRVQEFTGLAVEKQTEKLIAMLSSLKDDEGFFQKISNIIKTNSQIGSQNLINIYKDILEFSQELKQLNKQGQSDIMNKLKQTIANIQQQEKIEREQEHPDDLLNDI